MNPATRGRLVTVTLTRGEVDALLFCVARTEEDGLTEEYECDVEAASARARLCAAMNEDAAKFSPAVAALMEAKRKRKREAP